MQRPESVFSHFFNRFLCLVQLPFILSLTNCLPRLHCETPRKRLDRLPAQLVSTLFCNSPLRPFFLETYLFRPPLLCMTASSLNCCSPLLSSRDLERMSGVRRFSSIPSSSTSYRSEGSSLFSRVPLFSTTSKGTTPLMRRGGPSF